MWRAGVMLGAASPAALASPGAIGYPPFVARESAVVAGAVVSPSLAEPRDRVNAGTHTRRLLGHAPHLRHPHALPVPRRAAPAQRSCLVQRQQGALPDRSA